MRTARDRRHNLARGRRGFTLVELMIVIAIIAVLAAVAVPNFRRIRERAQKKSCYANLRTLHGAVEWYSADINQDYVIQAEADFTPLVQQGYLNAPPACPQNGAYTAAGGAEQAICSVHGTISE